MNVLQGMRMALKSILGNKMRSLLTMLGIIIGVAAVIALVSIGQGTTKQITDQIQGLGTNLLTVNILGRGTSTTLSYEQAIAFAEQEAVKAVAPVNSSNASVKYKSNSISNVSIVGTNAEYLSVQDYTLAAGRFLGQIDLDYRQKVAIIGSDTATELFGEEDPIGAYILITGNRFKVVGLLESKGSSTTGSSDEIIMIPLTTAERQFQSKGVRTVYIQVEAPDQIDGVMAELELDLASIFRGNTNSYRIYNQEDLLETVSSVSNTLALALGGIAAISLVVGGIGIMNIMLVSVTERTREIGIRKAIGAKRRDILFQFLIEAIVLSGLGGVIGIATGLGIAQSVSKFADMDVVYSNSIILLAFSFSVCIGIVFGLFPANKAAKLKPIEALRFE